MKTKHYIFLFMWLLLTSVPGLLMGAAQIIGVPDPMKTVGALWLASNWLFVAGTMALTLYASKIED